MRLSAAFPDGRLPASDLSSTPRSSKLALFQRRKLTASLLLGLPAFASVTTYVEGQRPTLQGAQHHHIPAILSSLTPPPSALATDFSDYLLSSHEASFLSFEAHLTTFGAATFARALTQSGTFTILLPPSNRAEPTAHDRSGYLRLMHSAHVAPHLLGMFSEHGVHRTLSWDEPAVFPPLSATAGDFPSFDGRIRNSTVWLYRLSGGGPIVARSEPRLSQSQNIVLTEWALDTARVPITLTCLPLNLDLTCAFVSPTRRTTRRHRLSVSLNLQPVLSLVPLTSIRRPLQPRPTRRTACARATHSSSCPTPRHPRRRPSESRRSSGTTGLRVLARQPTGGSRASTRRLHATSTENARIVVVSSRLRTTPL